MHKGQSKDAVVVIDRLTMREVARYQGVEAAAADLELKSMTIRRAIHGHIAVYDCYWVYANDLSDWMPKITCWKRLKGLKGSEKLRKLLNR